MLNLFKILRPFNILLVALSQIGVIFFLQLEYTFIPSDLPKIVSLLLVTSLVMGAGYIINDIQDQTADAINKPKKAIVNTENINVMRVLYITLNVFALIQSVFFLGFLTAAYVLGIISTLYFYSSGIKRWPLLANLVIALTCIFPLILVYLHFPQVNKNLLTFYAILCFISTFIRELVKDIQDEQGDIAAGIKPLVTQFSKTVINQRILEITLFLTFLVGFSSYTLGMYFSGIAKGIFLAYMLLFVIGPLLVVLRLSWKESFDFKSMSTLLKYVLFTGILSMMFF